MFQALIDCSSYLEKNLHEHDSQEPIDIKYVLGEHFLSFQKLCEILNRSKGLIELLVDYQILIISKRTLKYILKRFSLPSRKMFHNNGSFTFFTDCFSVDVIGSCAFGLDCNSFKIAGSPFLQYTKKVINGSLFQQFVTIFAVSFPKLSRALHLKIIPTDVTKFFFDFVTSIVDNRKENNYFRNDFLQLLINMKSNEEEDSSDRKGE